jgi:hypothetical protein
MKVTGCGLQVTGCGFEDRGLSFVIGMQIPIFAVVPITNHQSPITNHQSPITDY